jgi:tRNA threonylcarbamoyladenosine biosynthesis protein TsaE
VIELRSPSPAVTHAIAAAIAGLARAGDLVILAGEMGSGKTWFAKGFAAALGVTDHVTSPTFTLVHSYQGGRLPLHHADVYRLDRLGEVGDLAIGELLEEAGNGGRGGVVLVEWGDAVAAMLGNDYLEVLLVPDRDEPDTARRVTLRAVGPSWAPRWLQLESAVAAWRC